MKLFAERLLRPGKELLKSAKNDILDSDPATLEHQAFNSSGTKTAGSFKCTHTGQTYDWVPLGIIGMIGMRDLGGKALTAAVGCKRTCFYIRLAML